MILPGIIAEITADVAAPPGLTKTGVSDFKNGIYKLAGSDVTISTFWYVGTNWWGTFDPTTSVTAGVGLICRGPRTILGVPTHDDDASFSVGDGNATYDTIVNPSNHGFVVVMDLVAPAYSTDRGSIQLTWLEASFAHEAYVYNDNYYVTHDSYFVMIDPNDDGYADTFDQTMFGAGPIRVAMKFNNGSTHCLIQGQTEVEADGTPEFNMTLVGFANYDPAHNPMIVEKMTFYTYDTDLAAAIADA